MNQSLELEQFFIPLISVCAVAVLIWFLVARTRRWLKAQWARRRHELNVDEMRQRWTRIEQLAASSGHEGGRLAVIDADKLLDFVLREMHMPGDTFALRMKFAQKKYFELKKARWAHELRNKIVHDPDFNLRRGQLHAALKDFRKALTILGAI